MTRKCTTHNERFHASGGAVSSDTEQVTSSFALVRALPMPPPAAKPPGVSGNAGATVQRDSETRKVNNNPKGQKQ